MNRRRLEIISLLIIWIVLPFTDVLGQDIKQEFLQKMKMVNEEVTSIQSDFVQERTLSIMEDVLVSSGEFYYKKPDLMKWDQQLPSQFYFILDGAKVIRYDGRKREEISANSPQVSHFKDFILGTVNGSMFESDEYATTFEKVNNEVTVNLVPQQKGMKKRIDKIKLVFDYDKMQLLELTIFEGGGDKTDIRFTNQKFNTISNNAVFQ